MTKVFVVLTCNDNLTEDEIREDLRKTSEALQIGFDYDFKVESIESIEFDKRR